MLETYLARLNKVVHYIGLVVLLLLMFLTVADVVGRYVFRWPIPGTFELTGLMLSVIVFFALGHTQVHRGHVRIDIITSVLSQKKASLLDSIIHLISAALLSLVVWQLIEHARRVWLGNEVSGVLSWPIYPFVIIAAFGALLYGLTLLFQFIDTFVKLVQRES